VRQRRRQALLNMAKAFESPHEMRIAQLALARLDPVTGPMMRILDDWARVHGDCPGCGHANTEHVAGFCYVWMCPKVTCGWSPREEGWVDLNEVPVQGVLPGVRLRRPIPSPDLQAVHPGQPQEEGRMIPITPRMDTRP